MKRHIHRIFVLVFSVFVFGLAHCGCPTESLNCDGATCTDSNGNSAPQPQNNSSFAQSVAQATGISPRPGSAPRFDLSTQGASLLGSYFARRNGGQSPQISAAPFGDGIDFYVSPFDGFLHCRNSQEGPNGWFTIDCGVDPFDPDGNNNTNIGFECFGEIGSIDYFCTGQTHCECQRLPNGECDTTYGGTIAGGICNQNDPNDHGNFFIDYSGANGQCDWTAGFRLIWDW